ncbi:MAG: ABC transporter permease [Clostridiales Family XIII bacterium]|jgi:peptide/nickel transport system permease protein|nr:ABC transporter permease [Clostridiales Family XIII bacterium]
MIRQWGDVNIRGAARYIAKRIAEFAVSVVALSFVIFSLLYIAPGDPARSLVGTRKATPELLARIREQYHLDDPFLSQYGRWLEGAFHFDFGESIRSGASVSDTIAPHAVVTFELVLISLAISAVVGVACGIAAAKGRGRLRDGAITVAALVGTSAPSYAAGLVFLYVFALKLGLFPIYGIGNGSAADELWHLALPAVTLAFGVGALLVQITRSAMLKEAASDYTVFMRARAISPLRVTAAQMKNASPAILTSAGLVLAGLFGSTVLVESVFSIPGLGNLLASSVTFHDVPVVQAIALLLAVFICAASTAVDICVYLINPSWVQRHGVRWKGGRHERIHA